jgi:hypothetical protein
MIEWSGQVAPRLLVSDNGVVAALRAMGRSAGFNRRGRAASRVGRARYASGMFGEHCYAAG